MEDCGRVPEVTLMSPTARASVANPTSAANDSCGRTAATAARERERRLTLAVMAGTNAGSRTAVHRTKASPKRLNESGGARRRRAARCGGRQRRRGGEQLQQEANHHRAGPQVSPPPL